MPEPLPKSNTLPLGSLLPRQPILVAAQPERDPAPSADPSIAVLHTPRLTLRPLTLADKNEFVRVIRISREHLEAFSPLHKPGESDETLFERQISLTTTGEAAGTAFRRIAFLPSGVIAGGFNLNNITRGVEWTADCNWWIAADQTGRGLATEALTAITTHALTDLPQGLGLSTICAHIQRDNIQSINLALRSGFNRAGEDRSYIQTGANWQLHDLYIKRCPAAFNP